MNWFLKHRHDLSKHVTYQAQSGTDACADYLLAIPPGNV